MDQTKRNRTLQRLRTGQVRLLVATDVAARGIDVRDITHVINFDLPRSAEDYVHRIGRTGRAGASGVAISFAARADRETLVRIERYTKATLEVHVVPGLEPTRPFTTGGAGRPAGRNGRPGGGAGKPWHRNGESKGPHAPRGPRPDYARNDNHRGDSRPDHGHARREAHGNGKPAARAKSW